MGKPAARLGDPTAHGGVITLGFPMVLIGGMPAARLGDMHMCPMMTPAVPPIPHVGGPIILGSPMVLIGGQPAARMGDMATCVGPPATILMGCPTVLIGEGGSGSASGGGAGSSAAAAAAASAATAATENVESFKKIEHWVEFQFTDKAGKPVSGMPYKFTDSDGKESFSILRPDGRVGRDAMNKGNCKVELMGVYDAKWAKDYVPVGEKIKLQAQTEGFKDGSQASLMIFKRDIQGPDTMVTEISVTVRGNKLEAEWEYPVPETGGKQEDTEITQYSYPTYYFEALVQNVKARSGLLSCGDWAEIHLKDNDGKSIGNKKYTAFLSSGEVRQGTFDGSGKAKLEKVPPGRILIKIDPRL